MSDIRTSMNDKEVNKTRLISTEIPVVFSMDDGYAMPTAVAIYSMLRCYSGDKLVIIILYRESLSELSKALINESIRKSCGGKEVILKYMDVAKKITAPDSYIPHITAATYYRLILPTLLSEYSRCLYLDGDIYVADDIAPLCMTKLDENEVIAGVCSTTTETARKRVREKKIKELGINDLRGYINAGVILMDLEKLRALGTEEKMLALISRNFGVQDQDIINVACYGKIKNIPPQYNSLPDLFRKRKCSFRRIYSCKDIDKAKENPCIIHYADSIKPWKYINVKFGMIWREAYEELFGQINIKERKLTIFTKIKMFGKRVGSYLKHIRKA